MISQAISLNHREMQDYRNNDCWMPHPRQRAFLASPAHEALFGGAAGPGKSDALLMEALRQIGHPEYRAILFRRTFPKLEAADGLIDRSLRWYTAYDGIYNDTKHYWRFPSGARIYFGHMQREEDKQQYQGAQYAFIAFDELTEFTQSQYEYLFTRNRVKKGIGLRAYTRAATNPGGIGHAWVKRRFITRDIVDRVRWFALVRDHENKEVDTEVGRWFQNAKGHYVAKSRSFYPAHFGDNPSLGDEYIRNLSSLSDEVERARLMEGDWDAEYKDGLIFDTWSSQAWPDGNVTAEAEYNPDLPLYWACDDGYVYGEGPGSASYHPRVVLMVQDNAIGGLDVIDEYVACEETHAATLTHLLGNPDGSPPEVPTRWQQYKHPTVAYMPSEAALFKGEAHKRGVGTVNGTHRVTEGIKAVRALDVEPDGMRRLRVNPRCSTFIYEKSAYRSDPKGRSDTGEIVPFKQDDHCMDAFRYLVFKRRHIIG